MLDPFERMAQRFWAPFNDGEQVLKTDISETDDQYQVKVDIPGIDKQDVKLAYRDNRLSIKVQKHSFVDHSDQKQDIVMNERREGLLQRDYMLPDVDPEKIKAVQTDGVLTITLPKSKQVTDSGKIAID